MDQPWAAQEAAAIGRRVAQRRKALRISAQRLADRCAELGMPDITRAVIAKLEFGRRQSVSTAELAVLAAALGIPPIVLLFPVGAAASVEYLPGKTAAPWNAARWWADEASLTSDGEIGPASRSSPGALFRQHLEVLSHLREDMTEADYTAARMHQFHRPGRERQDPAERTMMITVTWLREIRADIREQGLEPPPLPPGLKWLDEAEG